MSGPTDPRPHLVSVGGNAPESGDSTSAPSPEAEGSGRRGWLLLALVAVALIGLVFQSYRVKTLSAEVEALSGELFTARSALTAYDSRFREVRATVEGLQAQFDQLGALVASDPQAPVPETASESPPAAPPLD